MNLERHSCKSIFEQRNGEDSSLCLSANELIFLVTLKALCSRDKRR